MPAASSTVAGRTVIAEAETTSRSRRRSPFEGLVDTLAQGSRTPSELRGGCADPGGTLSRLVAAVPRPEGCPGTGSQWCPGTSEYALLAQSAEHSHGKAGVVGSIPTEGSTKWSGSPDREPNPRRRSSVGQSIRLIIGRSSVQVRSPLLVTKKRNSNEQGKVRAEQAACEYWDDGSHRPWEDDVDGGDFEDVVGAWVG